MSNKITNIIIEPSRVFTDSKFKLKVKAIRYLTYNELKTLTYNQVKNFTYGNLKGE